MPVGTDKSKGAVIRTSKFILVYDKLPEHEQYQYRKTTKGGRGQLMSGNPPLPGPCATQAV